MKVDVRGLASDTEYRYRFVALGAVSPTGRGITAPAESADVERLRFGVVSCSKYQAGFFGAYRHLAARDDLDAVIHLGDYLYESGGDGDIGRAPDPAHEIITLEDYRRRHALYKADPDLRALHARYSFVVTIDDHEVANNAFATGADAHDPATEGEYLARRAAAFRAYDEWMPARLTVDGATSLGVERTLRFGTLAEIVLLDLRTHRDEPPAGLSDSLIVTSPEPAEPQRTMLGAEQRTWLLDTLERSETAWRLIGNSVMFAPLAVADLPDVPVVGEALAAALAEAGIGVPFILNGDQWDGYQAEQAALIDAYGRAGNVVVLTGDIHSSWAAEIPVDPGTYLPAVGGASAAVEFVTPAVTSDGFSAAVANAGVPGLDLLAPQLPTLVPTVAPWFKYLDADRQGFGVIEVTASATQYDWHHVADRTDPDTTESFSVGWATPTGTNRLVEAAELPPRPPRDAAPSPVDTSGAPPPVEAAAVPSQPEATAAAGATLPQTGAAPLLPFGLVAGAAAAEALRRVRRSGDRSP